MSREVKKIKTEEKNKPVAECPNPIGMCISVDFAGIEECASEFQSSGIDVDYRNYKKWFLVHVSCWNQVMKVIDILHNEFDHFENLGLYKDPALIKYNKEMEPSIRMLGDDPVSLRKFAVEVHTRTVRCENHDTPNQIFLCSNCKRGNCGMKFCLEKHMDENPSCKEEGKFFCVFCGERFLVDDMLSPSFSHPCEAPYGNMSQKAENGLLKELLVRSIPPSARDKCQKGCSKKPVVLCGGKSQAKFLCEEHFNRWKDHERPEITDTFICYNTETSEVSKM